MKNFRSPVGWLFFACLVAGCPKNESLSGSSTRLPTDTPETTTFEDDTPSLGPGQSGYFDYYVLSLSWSPQFCSTRKLPPSDPQCGVGKSFGWIVHGLWPQYERGFPESCATAHTLSEATVTKMLPVMPSPKLIQHEWSKHGTCSGLSSETYFAAIEAVFSKLVFPEELQTPSQPVQMTLPELKQRFSDRNPQLGPGSLTVQCSSKYVREVRICLRKDLSPMPCTGFVRDLCKTPMLEFRPPRALTEAASQP